jgi:hypothetical protein
MLARSADLHIEKPSASKVPRELREQRALIESVLKPGDRNNRKAFLIDLGPGEAPPSQPRQRRP